MTKQKRNTKLIRISDEWHRQLKMKAARDGKTMVRVLDLLCRNYFRNPKDLPLDLEEEDVDDEQEIEKLRRSMQTRGR